ncbi:UNVERIFIED_CONTAM: hypothetical protein Sradi_3321700 [Sesamum radiatum]|uniref:RNase H type-1 domain-containing protein n=1 Tax=Sesamum radiatum TaxID=300843 RepID=A0AAW2R1R7_SESRA
MSSFLTQHFVSVASSPPTSVTRWQVSPLNFIKVNFDGATFRGNHGLGSGMIARDNSKACLGWLAMQFDSFGDGELAEAMAARDVVLLALHRGWLPVIFEGDCATLIHKLQTLDHDLSLLGPIIVDIHYWASCFHSCPFQYVK